MTNRRYVRVGLAALFVVTVFACSSSNSGNPVTLSGGTSAGGSHAGGAGGIIAGGTFGMGGTLAVDGAGGSSASGGSSGGAPISDCPGPLNSTLAQALAAGGPVDGAMKWLYPYDKTVFPRGLISPVLQWSPAGGVPATAVYLHLYTNGFDYKGCYGPTDPARLQIPQAIWDQATTVAIGMSNPLYVELTTAQNGGISGPIKEVWAIAPATLKGEIFYNTYGSPQVQNDGAVMRLIPGQPQPTAFLFVQGVAPLGPCMSCHSLSANGQGMVAANHFYGASVYQSFSYNLQPNTPPNPPAITGTTSLDEAGFAAVYPDGTKFMTVGSPGTTINFPFPNGPGNVVGMIGPRTSRLFQMNGTQITPNGWNVQYANMPMFSPDGTKIVFNHYEDSNGHSLAIMDFNTNTNTFSNYQKIFQDSTLFPGWPFFTPDNKGVIFVLGDAADYVSAHPARPVVAHSDVYYVDVASKSAVPLARANGFDGNVDYLPYPGRDERYNFFPTVSPVAAGGQFWLFFTSRRNYGNTIVGDVSVPASKKIWVSAIDIDAPAGSDPSHPAFYLPGQEEGAGNVRAFASLEPCRADGSQCQSGIDCCCGACNNGVCGCPQGCSKLDEKCTTSADCCDAAMQCIGGFCEPVVPR